MIIFIDLFCGAGGVTTGIEKAKSGIRKAAKVIACVNHDALAIKSHARNHKNVLHFTEDIRTLDLSELKRLKDFYRAKYPHAAFAIWASLECTNFSKAKGGQPRDADSRTLAEHLFRYEEELEPDYIYIENVVEFMSWGPLDENGKPVSRKNGSDFMRWIGSFQDKGFRFDYRVLNAADFGAYTSRERFFAQFAKGELPIAWPKPTHAKKPEKSMFGALQPWKAVKDVLNFKDEGESIFGRKKPLVEKTLERIYAGLKKYVAGGDDAFLSKYYSGRPDGKNIPVEGPAGTITCVDGHALVKAAFITKYLSNDAKTGVNAGADINMPSPTVTTQNRLYLTQASFLTQSYGGLPSAKVYGLEQPARTICTTDNQQLVSCFLTKYHGTAKAISVDTAASTLTCRDRLSLIQTTWLDKNYSSGDHNHQSVEQPAGALTTNNHYSLITSAWIDKCYSGKDNHSSIETAAGTITTNPHLALMQCKGWVMPTNFDNIGRSLEEPCPTLLASRKHHYLVNPQFNSKGCSVELPAPTLIAKMDKRPLSIVTVTESGQVAIVLDPNDSPTMQKIKLFMAEFGIVDIKMRMLKVPELKLIQGFPKNYYLAGNQSHQKKFIGNSVCPDLVSALISESAAALNAIKAPEKIAA